MGTHQEQNPVSPAVGETDEGRRAFLAKCGKFAVVTSPAVTLLLDTSMASATVYASGSPGHGHGHGRRRRRRGHRHEDHSHRRHSHRRRYHRW